MERHEVHIESLNGNQPPMIRLAAIDPFEAEHFAADLRRDPRWLRNVVRVVPVIDCEYCESIEAMTGTRNCPIHAASMEAMS